MNMQFLERFASQQVKVMEKAKDVQEKAKSSLLTRSMVRQSDPETLSQIQLIMSESKTSPSTALQQIYMLLRSADTVNSIVFRDFQDYMARQPKKQVKRNAAKSAPLPGEQSSGGAPATYLTHRERIEKLLEEERKAHLKNIYAEAAKKGRKILQGKKKIAMEQRKLARQENKRRREEMKRIKAIKRAEVQSSNARARADSTKRNLTSNTASLIRQRKKRCTNISPTSQKKRGNENKTGASVLASLPKNVSPMFPTAPMGRACSSRNEE